MLRPLSAGFALIAFAGTGLLGAAQAQDDRPLDPQAQRDQAAIYVVIHRMETAWRENAAEDMAVNFAPDGELVSFGDRRITGRPAIQTYYERVFSGLFRATELDHLEEDISIRFLAPDVAIATYEAGIGPTTDAVKPACSPVTTVVMTRRPSPRSEDGEWTVDYLNMSDSAVSDCMAPGR